MNCKTVTLFLILTFLSFTSHSQEKPIGWYHLLPGAETTLLDNLLNQNKMDTKYGVDEILLLFDFKGSYGYSVDVDGRIVLISDVSKIKKIDTTGRVVKIVKEINVSLKKTLLPGNNVFLVGFNSVNNTAKILLASGLVVEIPKDAYIDLRSYFEQKNIGKYETHKVLNE